MKTMKGKAQNKSTQEKLTESQERYKILVETIPDIMYELDTDGKFIFLSEAINNLGYTCQDLIGKHFSEIVHSQDLNKVSRSTVLVEYKGKVTGDAGAPKLFDERRTGKRATKNLEVRLALKKQKGVPQEYCYAEVHSSGKWGEEKGERKFLGSIGIVRDISERKLAEEVLKRANEELGKQTLELRMANDNVKTLNRELEKNNVQLEKLDRLKSDFLSTVSHELRTPLTTIREGVSQVLDGALGATTKEQREFLTITLEDIERLERIINDLLDISKIEAGKVDLNQKLIDISETVRLISSSFISQTKSKGLDLMLNIPEEEILVYADRDKIIQVLTNLIGNAIKFTKKGYIEISVREKRECIECSIFDTGQGISVEHLPNIFDKFQQFTRSVGPGQKGTGLGLSIAKGIIDLHQGDIFVESKLDKGSKFTFTLPKHTPKSLFSEYARQELSEATKHNTALSLVTFRIRNFSAIERSIGQEKAFFVMANLEELIKNNLRRKRDRVVKDIDAAFVMLPLTESKIAIKIVERIQRAFDSYLMKEKLKDLVDFEYKIAAFPRDGRTVDDLLNKIHV